MYVMCMAKVNTNISLDPHLKEEAQLLFSELGLDLSGAISLFLSQAVREQAIPFKITKDVPNRTTRKAMKEIEKIEKNPEKYKSFSSPEELFKDLDNEI